MDDEAVDAVIEYKTPIVPTFTFQANLADYGEVVGASQEIRNIFKREIVELKTRLRQYAELKVAFPSPLTENGIIENLKFL